MRHCWFCCCPLHHPALVEEASRASTEARLLLQEFESVLSETLSPRPAFRLPLEAPLDPATIWQSTYHWNGMAVYQEPLPGAAFAASCTIKSCPQDVFRHLVRLDNGQCAWDLLRDVTVLDSLRENEHKMVRLLLRAPCLIGCLVACPSHSVYGMGIGALFTRPSAGSLGFRVAGRRCSLSRQASLVQLPWQATGPTFLVCWVCLPDEAPNKQKHLCTCHRPRLQRPLTVPHTRRCC